MSTLHVFPTSQTQWTRQERGEIVRAQAHLASVFGPLEIEHAVTDRGEPWAALVDCATQEVIAHFARIGRHVVADLPEAGVTLETPTLREAINRVLSVNGLLEEAEERAKAPVIALFGRTGRLIAAMAILSWEFVRQAGRKAEAAPVDTPREDETSWAALRRKAKDVQAQMDALHQAIRPNANDFRPVEMAASMLVFLTVADMLSAQSAEAALDTPQSGDNAGDRPETPPHAPLTLQGEATDAPTQEADNAQAQTPAGFAPAPAAIVPILPIAAPVITVPQPIDAPMPVVEAAIIAPVTPQDVTSPDADDPASDHADARMEPATPLRERRADLDIAGNRGEVPSAAEAAMSRAIYDRLNEAWLDNAARGDLADRSGLAEQANEIQTSLEETLTERFGETLAERIEDRLTQAVETDRDHMPVIDRVADAVSERIIETTAEALTKEVVQATVDKVIAHAAADGADRAIEHFEVEAHATGQETAPRLPQAREAVAAAVPLAGALAGDALQSGEAFAFAPALPPAPAGVPVFEAMRDYYLEMEIAGGPVLGTVRETIAGQIGPDAAAEALVDYHDGLRDMADDRPVFADMFDFA